MAKYLVRTTEVYRVDNEREVETILAEAKNNPQYELAKYSSQHKEVKSKGELLDEYELLTLTKAFNIEKEPDREIEVFYGKEPAATNEF